MKTKKVKYYRISDQSTKFDTLSEAKRHFEFYTLREKIAEVGNCILGYDYSDNLVSFCRLRRVDKQGRLYFTRQESVPSPQHLGYAIM